DHLGEDLPAVEADVQADAAREDALITALGLGRERLPARGARMVGRRRVRRRSSGVVAVLGAGNGDGAGKVLLRAVIAPACDRDCRDRGDETDANEPDRALDERRAHGATTCNRSPNASRT